MRGSIVMLCLCLITGAAGAVETSHPAPDFTLKSFAGENLRLQEYRGKVVLVNFWASWCGPCRQEMPILDRIQKRYGPLGLVTLGVNVDTDESSAREIAGDAHVTFPLLLDRQQEVSHSYQVAGMPFSVLIDRDGNVQYIHRGYKPGDEKEYINRIRQLLGSGNPGAE